MITIFFAAICLMKGRFDKEEGFPGISPENVTLNQQECSVYSYIVIKKKTLQLYSVIKLINRCWPHGMQPHIKKQ